MHVDLEESLRSAVESYRAALISVGDAGAKAYPPTGDHLKQSLLRLQQELVTTATPGVFVQAEQSVGRELKAWSDSAAHYYEDRADEIKALLLQVAKAAADVGNRDQRYGDHLQQFASRLEGAAKLDNITSMRQSLSSSAVELVKLVDKMTADGKQTVDQLRAQISTYQERTEKAERLASTDPLTGVCNRRVLERQVERRVAEGSSFFLVYLDLNEFKQVNDTLGHLAGDDLLKQFASELSHSFRPTDLVGRLGGDEFLVVVDGAAGTISERIGYVKKQVNGEYSVSTNAGKRKVSISAAVGIAVSKPGKTAKELLDAADGAMYADKKRTAEAKIAAAPVLKA